MNDKQMTIAIASDHAGYRYKREIVQRLQNDGYKVIDFGTDSDEPVDYPGFIRPAAECVATGEADLGIVFGGSGNGEAIVANKVRGIRCAVCWNEKSARYAKEHNDANIISIGQRMMSAGTAVKVVNTWLTASFKGGRHARRIRKIENR